MGRDKIIRPASSEKDSLDTPVGGAESLPVFSTRTLFAGATEILIQHNGDTYRLRITRNGKLILNK